MSDASNVKQRTRASADREAGQVFSSIVCAVDGSRRSLAAVEQAAILARGGGQLTLLAVTAVAGTGRYISASINPWRAGRILARATHIAHAAGADAPRSVVDPRKPVADVILEWGSQSDLLALGAPATSRAGALLLDGVFVTALGSCTCPLLIARPTPPGTRFATRILVASDGSPESDHVIELAGRVAHEQGASLMLLHAIGIESRARPLHVQTQIQTLERLTGGVVETRIEVGDAHTLITAAARDEHASLVIVGSRRLGGLSALGSVSRRVVHKAPCSIILVPPADHRS
jgi:nucleotide-binding universal stress UspA family protein